MRRHQFSLVELGLGLAEVNVLGHVQAQVVSHVFDGLCSEQDVCGLLVQGLVGPPSNQPQQVLDLNAQVSFQLFLRLVLVDVKVKLNSFVGVCVFNA